MKRYIVDSAAIRQNLETLKKRAGKAQLFAVVKGNGYGLGLVPLAAICRDAGVTTFCTVSFANSLVNAGSESVFVYLLSPWNCPHEYRRFHNGRGREHGYRGCERNRCN